MTLCRVFSLLVLALLVYSCSPAKISGDQSPAPAPAPAGPEPTRDRHVVNGSLYHGHPHVVYLSPNGCTGTVIGPRSILTAAHCENPITVGIGSDYPNLQTFAIKKIIRHPTYIASKSRDHDIAVLHLYSPVPVSPATLASTRPNVGEFIEIIGFGSTDNNKTDDRVKRRGTNNVGEVRNWSFVFKDLPGGGAASTCYGDSGAPTFNSAGHQIGVHNGKNLPKDWLKGQTCTKYKAVGIRVDKFRSWIQQNLASNVPTSGSSGTPPSSSSCGGVSTVGCCAGKTLKYCDKGAIKTKACAWSCGWDGTYYTCGGSGSDPTGKDPLQCPGTSGTSGTNSGSPSPPPPPPPADSCGGVTATGCCNGSSLLYCLKGQLKTASCGGSCGWNASNGFYDCGGVGADPSGLAPLSCSGKAAGSLPPAPPPPPPPPPPSGSGSGSGSCGGISFEGCCSGMTLKFCSSGALKTLTCSTGCGWAGSLYDCGHSGADPGGQHPIACP